MAKVIQFPKEKCPIPEEIKTIRSERASQLLPQFAGNY